MGGLELIDYGSLIGTLASIIGLCLSFAAWRAAVGAKEASVLTRNVLEGRSVLVELTQCATTLSHVRECIRQDTIEPAMVRLDSAITRLMQLEHSAWFSEGERRDELDDTIWTLGLIRSTLERNVIDGRQKLDKGAAAVTLFGVEMKLNEWVGIARADTQEEVDGR